MYCFSKTIVVIIGLALSIFHGWKYEDIFLDSEDALIKKKKELWAWRVSQSWQNFTGSMVGWAASFYYIFYRLLPLSAYSFKFEDTVPILIGLLGIIGFLPNMLSKVTSMK